MPSLLALLFLIVAALCPQDSAGARARADRLRTAGRFEAAAEAYEALTVSDPESGDAWFFLAYSRHAAGHYERAIAAGRRAAEFPSQRATALYNIACAQSLSGELDAAAASLAQALEAGFRDLDLLESDPDLDPLRASRELPGPPPHAFVHRRAPNGVTVPYFVREPAGYDSQRSYPALLVFSPGSGTRTADWAIEEFFAAPEMRADWLVVFVAPPERGWSTHPTHHALEDVLKRLKREYSIAGQAFHFVGLLGGARPALTYSQMSKRYAASLTVLGCTAWDSYDDSDWRNWRGMDVHLIEGERSPTATRSREVYEGLLEHGVRAQLTLVPDAQREVATLRGSVLRRALAKVLPAGGGAGTAAGED